MAAVHLALVVEAGPNAGAALAVAEACRTHGMEATVALNPAAAAAGGRWVALAKELDVGVRLPALPNGFAAAVPAYHAALFAAGRVPSCVLPTGALPPEAYAAMAEWNLRAVVSESSPAGPGACFLGGRLHLGGMISGRDLGALASQAQVRAAALAAAHGGAFAVHVPHDAVGDAEAFRAALAAIPGAATGSVRTAWNALQDIPYDHAVPLSAVQAMAAAAATGTLAPYRYELGYLAPAEQLSLLAGFWATALEKNRPGRNANARCPLPQGQAQTTAAELSAEQVAAAAKELHAAIRDRNELPAAVLGVRAEDLLPTFAAGFAEPWPLRALRVVRGHLPAGASPLHAWTFKPAIDFVPA